MYLIRHKNYHETHTCKLILSYTDLKVKTGNVTMRSFTTSAGIAKDKHNYTGMYGSRIVVIPNRKQL